MSDATNRWHGTGDGRTDGGLFAKGNQISRGHQGHRRATELKQALMACATDEDIRALYAAMLAAAKGGDVAAARLLLDHLIGKPRETIEVSAGDGQAIGLASVAAAIMEAIGDDERAREKVATAFARLGGHDGGVV
jgi:hypothetical protein